METLNENSAVFTLTLKAEMTCLHFRYGSTIVSLVVALLFSSIFKSI